MNKVMRFFMNLQVKRQMKKFNIPIPQGTKDVLSVIEERIKQKREQERSENKGQFDGMLANLPFEGYEVLATCDTCYEVDIIGCAPTLEEALYHAKDQCGMHMDDENVMHHYRTAVVKINREIAYTPEQISYEKDLDNK